MPSADRCDYMVVHRSGVTGIGGVTSAEFISFIMHINFRLEKTAPAEVWQFPTSP
jgi:hypothetical protein